MKNSILLIILALTSFQIWSQEMEEDLIFCKLERNPTIEAKITKVNDELYSFYVKNSDKANSEWDRVMDLGVPVVWSKNGVGEIADFYNIDTYNYWVRLVFNKSYKAIGGGEFLLPRYDQDEEEFNMNKADTYSLSDCSGTLK